MVHGVFESTIIRESDGSIDMHAVYHRVGTYIYKFDRVFIWDFIGSFLKGATNFAT
jgi:hypothetical protein